MLVCLYVLYVSIVFFLYSFFSLAGILFEGTELPLAKQKERADASAAFPSSSKRKQNNAMPQKLHGLTHRQTPYCTYSV